MKELGMSLSNQSKRINQKVFTTFDELGFTKQILPRFQVKVPYINENDYILFFSDLRKNDVNSIRKLNGLSYTNQEIVDIQFLNSLQDFKKIEKIFMVKKFQEKTNLSDKQIIKWGKYIGKDLRKMVKFKLSIKGSDVSLT